MSDDQPHHHPTNSPSTQPPSPMAHTLAVAGLTTPTLPGGAYELLKSIEDGRTVESKVSSSSEARDGQL